MVMKKDKSSEVYGAHDATLHSSYQDSGSLRPENTVCDKSHLSINQSDSLACVKDVAASTGSSENNVGYGTNDASKDVEMPLESNAREMVIQDKLSSKRPDVLVPTSGEEVSARVAKGGEMDGLPSCTELVKKKQCSSAAVNCNDQEKVKALIAQTPSACLDLEVDTAGDLAGPLLDTKVIPVGSSSQASAKGQTGVIDIDEKQSVDSLSFHDSDEKAYQLNGPEQYDEVNKHPLISSLESEGDEADLEEQDVKVCDICGDAGREDLLAICSRCTDGAEHTYCMREMLDEVPEGDWLCEECKSCEEMERRVQGHSEILGAKERSKQNSDSLSERKDPSLAGTIADNDSLTKRLPNKRRGSDIEVDPAAKRQVLESMVQSRTTSSPGSDGALSRDNSFKNTDKINAKLTHLMSISGRDDLEKPHTPNANVSICAKGSFFKSNSFGTSSSKSKVKMVVEIPQKNKQGVETKDASSKLLGKSMPFKGSLSRSNTIESKVKMLSPKDSHILEWRGLKQAKDRNLFERKNSIKLDHSSASQLAVNGCKNQLRGEVRRQQPSYPSTGGSSSTNSANGSADAKSSPSLKEGCTSSLSRLDGVNSEKNLDRSSNHSRQCVGDGNLQSSALDTSVRSLKDGVNEENKLKAAIQAAMQKRLDMCKRSKVPDKSNVVSVSNVDSVSERATLDRPNSMNSRNCLSAEGTHETEAASWSFSFNCVKETSVNNVNQSKVFPAGSVDSFRARNMDLVSSNVEQILKKSAIPDHEFAWIGSFEVYRGGSSAEQITGIQAHLSTCASYKVIEMVKKFPKKVPLSEVPRSCTWPLQFQDGGAGEDNIAVYFFAKDVESYERSYKNLLEKMMKDDLALQGNIDGIDLLIFPSKQLTKRSQRWNMLFFIWGVFRCRTESCLDRRSGNVEKLDLSSLNTNKGVTSDTMSPPEKTPLHESVKENISTTKSDQDVGGQDVFVSAAVVGKESPSLSNGNRELGEHSPHKTSSYVMKKHHESRNAGQPTCYDQEAICGRGDKSTLVVGYGDPDSVKVGESQTSSSLSGASDSSVKAEKMSVDQCPVVVGSREQIKVAKVKDERSQMKIEDTLKDEGCRKKLEGDLNKDDTSVGAVNDQYQTRVEGNSRQEEQCKEKEKYRGKVILGCELKQEEADVQNSDDVGGSSSLVRDVKMVAQQHLLQRKQPQEDNTANLECPAIVGQKRPLNNMNVAFDGGDEETAKERLESSILFRGPTPSHDVHGDSTALEKRCKAVSDKEMPPDSASAETERYFFPVDSHPSGSIQSRDDALHSSKVASTSLGTDDYLTEGFPNLELALGVENRRTKSGRFLGLVDGHRFQLNSLDVGRRKEDEEASAALSLSLAFPFGEKERSTSGAAERAFPEREPDK